MITTRKCVQLADMHGPHLIAAMGLRWPLHPASWAPADLAIFRSAADGLLLLARPDVDRVPLEDFGEIERAIASARRRIVVEHPMAWPALPANRYDGAIDLTPPVAWGLRRLIADNGSETLERWFGGRDAYGIDRAGAELIAAIDRALDVACRGGPPPCEDGKVLRSLRVLSGVMRRAWWQSRNSRRPVIATQSVSRMSRPDRQLQAVAGAR